MWADARRDGLPAKKYRPRWRRLRNFRNSIPCTTPQSLADARCRSAQPCSNAAKTQKTLKLPGVPQTNEMISADSGPKFTILCEHVEEILLLNKFFLIVDTCLSCKDIARQSCEMVPRFRFLATYLHPVFSASRMQQVSDLHLKFALRPRHVSK